MGGTAAALLVAGCSSTGSTGTGAAKNVGAAGTSLPTAASTDNSAAAAPSSGGADGSAGGDMDSVSGSPSGGSAADGGSSSGAGAKAAMYDCDQQSVSKPTTYTLLCGDGGARLDKLVWSNWGAQSATATATLTEKSCDPNCASGTPVSSSAKVTLSGLSDGHYTKLHIVTSKATSDYSIDSMGPISAS